PSALRQAFFSLEQCQTPEQRKKGNRPLRPKTVRYRFVRLTPASHVQLSATPICRTFAELKQINLSGNKTCKVSLQKKKRSEPLHPRTARYRFVRLTLASHVQPSATPICHTSAGLQNISRSGNNSRRVSLFHSVH